MLVAMISRLRAWLRVWLGIEAAEILADLRYQELKREIADLRVAPVRPTIPSRPAIPDFSFEHIQERALMEFDPKKGN